MEPFPQGSENKKSSVWSVLEGWRPNAKKRMIDAARDVLDVSVGEHGARDEAGMQRRAPVRVAEHLQGLGLRVDGLEFRVEALGCGV